MSAHKVAIVYECYSVHVHVNLNDPDLQLVQVLRSPDLAMFISTTMATTTTTKPITLPLLCAYGVNMSNDVFICTEFPDGKKSQSPVAVAVEPHVEKVESSTPTPEPPQQQQKDGELRAHTNSNIACIHSCTHIL